MSRAIKLDSQGLQAQELWLRYRPHWVVWHPHERLYNWLLVSAVRKILVSDRISGVAIGFIVFIDSILLFARTVFRRIKLCGLSAAFGFDTPSPCPRVFYLDCGTHKEAQEIELVKGTFSAMIDFNILGFEANEEYFAYCTNKYRNHGNIEIINCALVDQVPESGTIKLYKDGGDGNGDSLFSERGTQFNLVKACKLSEILLDKGVNPERDILLLRMNIEGAESLVLNELVDAGLHSHIDGFYGMWDDLSKIDLDGDRRFRSFLNLNKIKSHTFNARDMKFRLRRFAIKYDLVTSIRRGSARKLTRSTPN